MSLFSAKPTMAWSDEATKAIDNVPFFVRKRVKARVEAEAAAKGRFRITLKEVEETRKNFLSGMHKDVEGYRIEACFGESGCPNRIQDSARLIARLRETLDAAHLRSFLQSRLGDRLKYHHEFRLAIADCPNACSQPQIRDIGILAAVQPRIGDALCTHCGACMDACIEGALAMAPADDFPRIDTGRCVRCGQCIAVCPGQTLIQGTSGWRVMLGGKLGRHPQLAQELAGLYDEDAVVQIVSTCIAHFKNHFDPHRRFGDLLPIDGLPASESCFTSSIS